MGGEVNGLLMTQAGPPLPATPVHEPNAESGGNLSPPGWPGTSERPRGDERRGLGGSQPRETDAPPGGEERGETKAGTDAPRAGQGRGGSPSPSSSSGSSSIAQQPREAEESERPIFGKQPVKKKPKSDCSPGGDERDTAIAPPLPVATAFSGGGFLSCSGLRRSLPAAVRS